MALNWTRSFAVAALALGCLAPAWSAGMLLDRGLPTINLNDDAGANRSNVRWWSGIYTDADTYVLEGDTFKNTSGQTWHITKLRMWAVDELQTATLYGGLLGSGSFGQVSTAFTNTGAVFYPSTTTTYTDTVSNPPNTTSFNIYQIEFDVNIMLAAGDTYQYFFDGMDPSYAGPPMLHASNRDLSHLVPKDGDNLMWEALLDGGAIQAGTIASWDSNGLGWDKSSDFNIQVIGAAIPEPGSLALAGLALVGMAATARRRRS